MTTKLITSGAIQTDADLCNAIATPARGCSAGGGLQIFIPADWQARILAGQEVPGCTYHHLELDGSLYVTDLAQAQLAIPAVVNALSLALKTEAPLLTTKLASAVIASQAVAG